LGRSTRRTLICHRQARPVWRSRQRYSGRSGIVQPKQNKLWFSKIIDCVFNILITQKDGFRLKIQNPLLYGQDNVLKLNSSVEDNANLIPKKEVSLAELKLFNIEGLGKGNADNVKGSEKPAATRAFLVGNRLDFRIDFVLEDMLRTLLKATPGSADLHRVCPSAGILP